MSIANRCKREDINLQNPNLKRYIARVTGSAYGAYSGRLDSSTYGGGTSVSWRLSWVRVDVKVYPKKSSVGSMGRVI